VRPRTLLIALAAALAYAGVARADLPQTLADYDAAFGEIARAFAAPTQIQQVDDSGEQVDFHWQQGKYREEYRWLGFTEVFAYDGSSHWYGSDINLPYALDGAAPASITLELCRSFAFLQGPWRGYLSEGRASALAGKLPDKLLTRLGSGNSPKGSTSLDSDLTGEAPALLHLEPPGMAESLLALDNGALHVYLGDRRLLSDSHVIIETKFSGTQQFGACAYPSQVDTQTYEEGQLVHTQTSIVHDVVRVDALPDAQFSTAGSPPVASPRLPSVPYTVDVQLDDGAVIVPCTAPDGRRLKLALDTGANIGLLRRDIVTGLGLTPIGKEQVSGHGGRASVGYVRVENLRIGNATVPAWPAAVMQSEDGLDRRLGLTGVDGLLGNFLLHSYVVRIDYPRHNLTLWPRDQFDPAQLNNAFAAPLHRERLPWTDVVVDETIKGGAYFNTGGRYPFSLAYWACDDAGITYPIESMGRGVSVGGSAMFGMIRPGEVRIPGSWVGAGPAPARRSYNDRAAAGAAPTQPSLTLDSPLTMLEMLAPGEPKARWRIGSFGSGFLKDYAVTFDLERSMVYLEP
jgi:hypothetical protein